MELGQVEEYYQKYADALVRFAATMVGPIDAEDLVAMVMTQMLQSGTSEPSDPSAYLYRAVANAARKHWRTSDRRRRRDALAAPIERYEHHEFVPEVIRSLSTLSPQQRAVVHLTYWEDLRPAAVAGRLGIGEGTVTRQLARARRRLREVLHDEQ